MRGVIQYVKILGDGALGKTSLPLLFALFLSLFLLIIAVHQIFKRQTVIADAVDRNRKKRLEKEEAERSFTAKYGDVEKKSLVYKYDRLFRLSGVRWITSEHYLYIVLTVAIVMLTMVSGLTTVPALGFLAAAGTCVVGYLNLSIRSNCVYVEIENNTPMFISLISNYAKSSSDILGILKLTEPHLTGQYRRLVHGFIENAELYGSTDIAFDIMKDSVDNHQLRIIIANLKTCSHYEANYETVLSQILQQTTLNLSAKAERKLVLTEGKITVALIAVITGAILVLMSKMFNINIQKVMFDTLVGQAIVVVQGLVYLFVITFLFSVDKER